MNVGAIAISVSLLLLVTTWIVVVVNQIGTVPVYNSDGSVRMDEYSRTKDLLALLLSLLTTAAGFWFGSQRDQVRRKSRPPPPPIRETAQDQRAAILSVSPPMPGGGNVLKVAKEANPDAFGVPANTPEPSRIEEQ
jgi:hypothetical protein